MSTRYDKYAAKVFSQFYDAIEETFLDKVSDMEACDPTDDMIREHARRLITPDGDTILTWKGIHIVKWSGWPQQWSTSEQTATITFKK